MVGRVLVVDDGLTVRDVVRRYLELAGHRVSLADNGEDALRWIADNEPDLVVLDLFTATQARAAEQPAPRRRPESDDDYFQPETSMASARLAPP